jgi:hypothetical protein
MQKVFDPSDPPFTTNIEAGGILYVMLQSILVHNGAMLGVIQYRDFLMAHYGK